MMRRYAVCVLVVLTVCLQASADNIVVNLENEQVSAYLNEVEYVRNMPSVVTDYSSRGHGRQDWPVPAVVRLPKSDEQTLTVACVNLYDRSDVHVTTVNGQEPEARIYNLVPQQTYYYMVSAGGQTLDEGYITTEGRLRMIRVASDGQTQKINNVRDLGGWLTTDGRRVKYGKLYRGCEVNGYFNATDDDLKTLRDLGIEAEIDMRYEGENEGAGLSGFGFTDPATYLFTDNSGCCALQHLTLNYWQQRYKKEMQFIIDNLRNGRPVYFHCVWGADRTGMLAMFVEALLGVPYDGIVKDFELTTFSGNKRTWEERTYVFDYFDTLQGQTLQEKVNYYFVNRLRMSQADLDFLREALLEGDGESTVGIGTSHQRLSAPGTSYDLRGLRVDAPAKKGIRIRDGRITIDN